VWYTNIANLPLLVRQRVLLYQEPGQEAARFLVHPLEESTEQRKEAVHPSNQE
jgi:hypothetical protein